MSTSLVKRSLRLSRSVVPNAFAGDDTVMILKNPTVQASRKGRGRLWTTDYVRGIVPDGCPVPLFQTATAYRPVAPSAAG